MARSKQIDGIFRKAIKTNKPRAGSLIITFFGDAISQHGNEIWLGSLIDILAIFGLNSRQIRTAVYRLVQQNWLIAEPVGRRSYYKFSGYGQRQYERAAARIYAKSLKPWDEQWTLVIPSAIDIGERESLKRQLSWLGFGQLATGVLAHPAANESALLAALQELNVQDRVIVMRASANDVMSHNTLKALSVHCWALDELAQRLAEFHRVFSGALKVIEKVNTIDDQQAFELRTLMIHEYRRILLRTTDLPLKLLPKNWPGNSAMNVAAELYLRLRETSSRYLVQSMECPTGTPQSPGKDFYHRFS